MHIRTQCAVLCYTMICSEEFWRPIEGGTLLMCYSGERSPAAAVVGLFVLAWQPEALLVL
jgi:hypothetical protein